MALFTNNIIRVQKWVKFNRNYEDFFKFKVGLKLDEETLKERVNFINNL
jgi:hypothetical protein